MDDVTMTTSTSYTRSISVPHLMQRMPLLITQVEERIYWNSQITQCFLLGALHYGLRFVANSR